MKLITLDACAARFLPSNLLDLLERETIMSTGIEEVTKRRQALPAFLGTRSILLLQGLYYLLTGLWPIVTIRSFEAVTGPKTEHWLVYTVAILIVVISLSLLTAAGRSQISAETIVLAMGAALALTLIDIVFVARGDIAPIYLLDAAAEVVLLGWWMVCLLDCAEWKATKPGATHQ